MFRMPQSKDLFNEDLEKTFINYLEIKDHLQFFINLFLFNYWR